MKAIVTVVPTLGVVLAIGLLMASANMITGVTPNRGTSLGGDRVTITGSGFTDYTQAPGVSFSYTGACQPWTVPQDGIYRLETWGAQGGNANTNVGGRGGYSVGDVRLTAGTVIYICVGGAGTQASRTSTSPWPGGFNGGGGAYRTDNGNGHETASGGGATDIRIGINSLYARAIVAGGGGGAAGNDFGAVPGGAGGGASGLMSTGTYGGGAGTQTIGGANNASGCTGTGTFGTGVAQCSLTNGNSSGGGGGWFGGGGGLSGGGGSGFVFTATSNVNSSVIGGNFLLNNTQLLSNASTVDGSPIGTMPAPGGGTQTGQSGNGFARVTLLAVDVTIGGLGCQDMQVVSDTEISCVTPAHSAGLADVAVTVAGVTSILANGFTFTDSLTITGPTSIGTSGGSYVISLDYNYTGWVTLTDGGLGGTFSGTYIQNGNQIYFDGTRLAQFNYTPPEDYRGQITIIADSGNSYVDNGRIDIMVNVLARTFAMECYDGSDWVQNTFVTPGAALPCRIILQGAYEGTISLADIMDIGSVDMLGGIFTSDDARFAGGVFTTTIENTTEIIDQTLSFVYTSPSWQWIMDNQFDGTNGYSVFWPVITANATPMLTGSQNMVSVGLLAQAYEIVSIDVPQVGLPSGAHTCLGCGTRFNISTFNAPYFGTITLDSSVVVGGVAQQGGLFSRGASAQTPTFDIEFNGSGADTNFSYTPNVVGDDGVHTISGTSSGPVIADASISFLVIESHISIICTPDHAARGQSVDCTLTYSGVDGNTGFEIDLSDIMIGMSDVAVGDGVFTDTSGSTSNPSGTMSGRTYAFCGGNGGTDCTGETFVRTFTYTVPSVLANEWSRVRVVGENTTTGDTNWAIITVVPDYIDFYCAPTSPDCQIARVGQLQDYMLRPNGVFTGRVQLSDGDPNSLFSDGGIASWDSDSNEFDFEYTPATPGIKTLTATVIEVDGPSGINVGDVFTMTVYVIADDLEILGPDFIARDDAPTSPRFSFVLNGPYEGAIQFGIWRNDGTTSTLVTNTMITGTNVTSLGGGLFECVVTYSMWDPVTNTTTACMADNAPNNTVDVFAGYNYFEARALVPSDPGLNIASKVIGIIADDYEILFEGADVTANVITTTVGTPLMFTFSPNALFAGIYSFDDGGARGFFTPMTRILVSQAEWPAVNDQTTQTRSVTYVPLETGEITLTFDATRTGVAVPVGAESLDTKTVTLLVMANEATITGPSRVVRGQTGNFTLTLNGPYEGTIDIDSSLPIAGNALHDIAPTSCTFTLADWDPVTNTTSCNFTFTALIDPAVSYVNTVEIFSSPLVGVAGVELVASDFTVTPGPELQNQKINNPIAFTITPNAMFDGQFQMAIVPSGNGCMATAGFNGVFDTSTITYTYLQFLADRSQDPISQDFTFTPQSAGRVCIEVTPIPSDSGIAMSSQIIEIHVHDAPAIGGPNTIVWEQTSGTYLYTVPGEFNGVVNFSIWDNFAGTEISGATITTSQGGSSCTFTNSDMDAATGLTTCTFIFTLPATFEGNWVQIRSDDGTDQDTHDVAVLANAFTVTPAEVLDATLDTPYTFTIQPNRLFAGNFSLSDDHGDGIFSSTVVNFSANDWPNDQTTRPSQAFIYTPKHFGESIVTVTSSLGTETVRLMTLAESMSLTGPESIQLGSAMSGLFTLNIHGPYVGTVDLSVRDTATGAAIPGATLVANSEFCTFGLSDYDATTNTTSCDFTITLPAGLSSNHITITAETAPGSRALPTANMVTTIMANDFAMTSDAQRTMRVGDVVTFTITPNAVFDGIFSLGSTGAGNFSPNNLSFTPSEYATTDNVDIAKTFTFTPTAPGRHVVTVASALGSQEMVVYVLADGFTLTPTSAVGELGQPTTFTITPNGLFEGELTFNLTDATANGEFMPTTIIFTELDWTGVNGPDMPSGMTFTYTPTRLGQITITATDANAGVGSLGSQSAVILVSDSGGGENGGGGDTDIDAPDTGVFEAGSGVVVAAVFGGLGAVIATGVGCFALRKRRRF